MKKIKINLSKTSWIILSVGVFIVVLAGLGVTYSQQVKEKNELQDELAVTNLRLEKYNIEELQQEENQLLQAIEAEAAKLESAVLKINQSIESIDTTDNCYLLASQNGVEVVDIATTETDPNRAYEHFVWNGQPSFSQSSSDECVFDNRKTTVSLANFCPELFKIGDC